MNFLVYKILLLYFLKLYNNINIYYILNFIIKIIINIYTFAKRFNIIIF